MRIGLCIKFLQEYKVISSVALSWTKEIHVMILMVATCTLFIAIPSYIYYTHTCSTNSRKGPRAND